MASFDDRHWQQVAPIELPAVNSDEVDLVTRVDSADIACRGEPISGDLNADNRSVVKDAAPLALNAGELTTNFKDEVIATMLCQGPVNGEAELRCRLCYCQLGHIAFDVR